MAASSVEERDFTIYLSTGCRPATQGVLSASPRGPQSSPVFCPIRQDLLLPRAASSQETSDASSKNISVVGGRMIRPATKQRCLGNSLRSNNAQFNWAGQIQSASWLDVSNSFAYWHTHQSCSVRHVISQNITLCSRHLPLSLSFLPPGLCRSQPVCSLNRPDLSKDFATTLNGLLCWGRALCPQPHMLLHQISEI